MVLLMAADESDEALHDAANSSLLGEGPVCYPEPLPTPFSLVNVHHAACFAHLL